MMHYTIAIINWNSWKVLKRCLQSLSVQSYHGFDIQIVDNCSDEKVPEGIFDLNPNVHFSRNTENLGFAAANNQVLKRSEASGFIILLNPDAFPEIQWLEKLIRSAEKYPEYSVYGSRLMMANNNTVPDGNEDIYHISGLAWRDRKTNHGHRCYREPYESFSACAAAAMYKISAIKDVGGFDEDFFCYMEDVDLGFRLRLAGHKCLMVPEAIAEHIGSATTGGPQSDFAIYHGQRNLIWTYIKNMPGLLFWLFLPFHCSINLIAILWFSLRGQGKVIRRAKMDALRGLPKMWRKRTIVQKQRVASMADMLRVMDKSLIPLRRI